MASFTTNKNVAIIAKQELIITALGSLTSKMLKLHLETLI